MLPLIVALISLDYCRKQRCFGSTLYYNFSSLYILNGIANTYHTLEEICNVLDAFVATPKLFAHLKT